MTTLVLTVIGDDRAGLVKALADVVSSHGGNWERSHLAELAGQFAGIVVVTVPDTAETALRADLRPLEGLLDVVVHQGSADDGGLASSPAEAAHRRASISVLGNDHPGIVQAVSGALAAHGLSVVGLESLVRDAPMAGGRLFEAHAVVTVPRDADLDAVTRDLEGLAGEVQVDIDLEPDPD
ncbi:MAG: ACT domain-containing protein [Ornithinibacter sp.]